MSFYRRIQPMLAAGYHVSPDGKIRRDKPRIVPVDDYHLWVFQRQFRAECHLCHGVFFDIFGMLPTAALQCWKVVAAPRTLKELFAVRKLQQEMDQPAKCGVDSRFSVKGLYRGYWYNHSLAAGKECWKRVRSGLDFGIKVILKRGCTEFEHQFGRSDEWKLPEKSQIALEKFVRDNYEGEPDLDQPEAHKEYVQGKWIEWAWSCDDPTVGKYLKRDLYPGYVTYEKEI